ncbi:DUF7133 domain-containing protein [Mucilaginibacter antarcticus]|uniref:DUF7133 domain-containing protein n=1 Tax=Mucilaginibacter antarcticus TaxID=1855725 RepID=UPI003628892F
MPNREWHFSCRAATFVFYELANDKVVKRTLVDAKYTDGGNVEHQPNGLYRALDNWIYNANSEKRYRKQGDKWLTERSHGKGQWGITQDDQGRMYANDNSVNLQGDYFPPGLGLTNKNQKIWPALTSVLCPTPRFSRYALRRELTGGI